MSFDENIAKYMKQNSTKFKDVDDKSILLKEFEKHIATIFNDMKDTNDFLTLINTVNKAIYTDVKIRTIPIKMATLNYHAFHNKNKYTRFEISKKSGGTRTIYAPKESLKNIQTTINVILQCIYKPQMPVHGFRKNRSVVSGAKQHVGKNHVYNIDLKDFFPSIHKARIEKRLQVPPFNLNDKKTEISTLISRLTTHKAFEYLKKPSNEKELKSFEDGDIKEFSKKDMPKKIKSTIYVNSFKPVAILPQGAPTSPIISNFICDRLDRRLMGLAKRFNAKYTRYADDITFSSMHNVYQKDSKFLTEMHKIIKDQNFEINPKKTRLQKSGYKQEVTGLIVNDKVNVSRRYIKQLRAMLYSIEKHGLKKAEAFFIKDYIQDKGHIKKHTPNIKDVLHGKLEYLKMVKGSEDTTYIKLYERFAAIFPKSKKRKNNTEEKNNTKLCKVHNPKKLVKLLYAFSENSSVLKDTTHSWDWAKVENKYKDFNDFIKQVGKEWDKISKSIHEVAPKLHGKIYAFLRQDKLGEKNKNGYINQWGINNLKFGWSSPELKEWCKNDSNLPFHYILDEKYQTKVDKKTIYRFSDVVEVFKNEIEIKSDNKQLKKIFIKKKKEHLSFDFKVTYIGLEGIDFYTDVQWFEHGLDEIFKEMKKRTQHPNISIEAIRKNDSGYIELRITQEGSVPDKPRDEMIKEVDSGNFGSIKEDFCSLCDWSIEAKLSDGNYRINFLGMDKEETQSEELENEPQGFTHILRFYR